MGFTVLHGFYMVLPQRRWFQHWHVFENWWSFMRESIPPWVNQYRVSALPVRIWGINRLAAYHRDLKQDVASIIGSNR